MTCLTRRSARPGSNCLNATGDKTNENSMIQPSDAPARMMAKACANCCMGRLPSMSRRRDFGPDVNRSWQLLRRAERSDGLARFFQRGFGAVALHGRLE